MSDTRETEDKIIHGAKAITHLLLVRKPEGAPGFLKFSLWFFGIINVLILLALLGA